MTPGGILSWSWDFLSRAEPTFNQHKLKVPLQHSPVGQESKSKGGPLTSLSRTGLEAGVLRDGEPKGRPGTPSLPRCGLPGLICRVLPSTTSTLQKIFLE